MVKTYTYTAKGGANKNEEGWVEGTTAADGSTLAYGKKGEANALKIADGDKVYDKRQQQQIKLLTMFSADFDNGVSKSNSSIISAEQAVKLMTI